MTEDQFIELWTEAKRLRFARVLKLIEKSEADVRAQALEEAAKVADAPCPHPYQFDGGYQAGYADARDDIANAIRALKEKP